MARPDDSSHPATGPDPLDVGLRAAFGPNEPTLFAGASGRAAWEELAAKIGGVTRVALRDLPGEEPPVVRPRERRAAAAADGRYQLAGEIASGGVGVVLKTRDVDLGRDVAMKILRSEHAQNPAMVQRFIEEAQIAGQLQHPGVLPVYELGLSAAHQPFFTMKLVKGQTLAALLARRSDPAQDRARFLSIFEQVCQTVAYAHARGVIHRDLKPSNVMVGSFGEVQVVDWGLAKVLAQGGLADEAAAEPATVVATVRSSSGAAASLVGSVMGTPAYMPPEQARGEVHHLDERCDVFALGAILTEILTGKAPYEGDRAEILRRATEGDLTAAHARLTAVDAEPELSSIARQCLAPQRESRPRDAGTVAEQIAAFRASAEQRARDCELAAVRAVERADQERRARRLTVALACTLVALLAVGSIAYSWIAQERIERLAERGNALQAELERSAQLLGQAQAAPIGRTEIWDRVRAAGEQLRLQLSAAPLPPEVADRARQFLDKLAQAQRDRRVVERIEDVVIVGATHQDRESWEWMSQHLLAAFRDYGIDVLALPREEIVRRLRASTLAAPLTEGFELWIGTEFHLIGFGKRVYTVAQLLEWVEVLYQADTDPFRTQLRRLIYTGKPDLAKLRALAQTVPMEQLSSRTVSWLANAFLMAGAPQESEAVYERAMVLWPDELMLNFDYAYLLVHEKRWEHAIRYYLRIIALRPRVGGVWRALGIALHQTGDLPGALRAYEQSIRHQPDHAPTYIDMSAVLMDQEREAEALAALRKAIELAPRNAATQEQLGRALERAGDFDAALAAYERFATLSADDPSAAERAQRRVAVVRGRLAGEATSQPSSEELPTEDD